VAIAIARIKFDYEGIRTRLEDMDETVRLPPSLPPSSLSHLQHPPFTLPSIVPQAFTLEQLLCLEESLPNEEEIGTLQAYPGDTSRLGSVGGEGGREGGKEGE